MADPLMVETAVLRLLEQSPLALTGFMIAKIYMEKHEKAIDKLVSTFENEVKVCEERYKIVFAELMKIKSELHERLKSHEQ